MRAGDRVADRFDIDRWVAGGGMGAVFRARDTHTGELAAIKVLHAVDASAAMRFAREAQVLAELRHPGIVRYLAHGRTDAGELWLAMEWLDGEDLAARLASGEVSLAESLAIVTQAAAALAVAHARQIVHRDVKPSNLFLVDDRPDRLKLLDFGVARLARAAPLTESGLVVGTPLYMAPEQARGARIIDARVDVFALGAVLFRCLTGHAPFSGASPAELLAAIGSEAEAPRARELADVPPDLDELLARLLAKDPARRPRDGAALLGELLPFDATSAGAARPSRAEIGGAERRVQCLVLVTAPLDEALRVAAAAQGAELEPVDEGVVALVAGPGLATDVAVRAARLAMALRAAAPGAAAAVVTARGTASRAEGAEMLERAAALAATGPDRLRVDEATAGLLGSRFDVAGDTGGLRVTGERDPDRVERTLLGRATTFMGRDRELARLEGLFDDCVESGAARAVLLTAPAGAGKSRLRQELLARLAGRAEVWTGRGDPMRAGAPLGLLAEAVRRAARVYAAGEDPARRQDRIAARVARVLSPARAARVIPFLGELAGVPFAGDAQLEAARRDPVLLGAKLRDAFAEWVAAECDERPVVLVLEDLHWGDVPTVRVVGHALGALAERPFFVLGAARPEVHDLFPRMWAEHGLEEIHLGALPRRAAETLVRQSLGERASAELVAGIAARAGGNAFYLEELIRHVAAGGEGLPDSVLAMVAARFEAMGGESRRVLRAASVFGEVFWERGVEALTGAPAADALAELVEREVAQPRQGARLAGQREYAFRHGLLREAAYSTLTAADRAVGHRLAGAWLAGAGEPDAIAVAEHLERGGEAAGAAAAYARAADQALAASDLEATLAHAARAVALDPDGAAAGRARLVEAMAHRTRGDPEGHKRAGLEAARLLPEGSDDWVTAIGEAATACGKLFEKAELAALVERMEAALGGALTPRSAVALARAATQAFLDGEPELGEALLARIDPLPEHDPAAMGALADARGYRSFIRGALAPAREEFARAGSLFAEGGDPRSACLSRLEAAMYLWHLGDLDGALEGIAGELAEARRLGLAGAAAFGRAYLAMTRLALGDVAGALAEVEGAAAEGSDVRHPRLRVIIDHYHGLALEAAGRLDEAEAMLRRAVSAGDRAYPPIVFALASLASHLAARGAAEEAWSLAERATAHLDPARGVCPHEEPARLAHAEAARALGRPDAPALARLAKERLAASAALIPDDAARARFLAHVPVNRRIAALL